MAVAGRLALTALLALMLASLPLHAQDASPTHTENAHPEAAHPPHSEAGRPARGDAVHPDAEHTCLNQKERRAETDSGKLIRLSAAMHAAQHRLPGAVVRARLCRGTDGLVYVLTVLAHDGKVARISVDAMKGGSAADR
ncbi:MAG: hypothetical protein WBB34_05015 [Xanthobacteraceae bacterium]